MVFDDASGNAWIMKGFQLSMKPQRTYDDFMAAGPATFKKLPPGWKARVVTLEQDNHEVPEGGIARRFIPESISRTPTAVVAGP